MSATHTPAAGKYARLSKKTISGDRVYYQDWLTAVGTLADARNLPESIREQVTGPMLVEAWRNNETPAYFLDTVTELFGS